MSRSSSRARTDRRGSRAAAADDESPLVSRTSAKAKSSTKGRSSAAAASPSRSRSPARGRAPSASPARSKAARTQSPARASAKKPNSAKRRAEASDSDDDQKAEESRILHPKTPPPASPARRRASTHETLTDAAGRVIGSRSVITTEENEAGPGFKVSTRTTESFTRISLSSAASAASAASASAPAPGAPAAPAKGNDSKRVAAVVAFYFAVSLSMVFVNKAIFDRHRAHTLALTLVQLLGCIALSAAASCVGPLIARSRALAPAAFFFPKLELSPALLLQTLPTAVAFAAMLAFNNLCLEAVPVSFYQVARAWTVICSMLVARVWFGQRPSWREVACCLVIVAGYLFACAGAPGLGTQEVVAELRAHADKCALPFRKLAAGEFAPSALLACATPSPRFLGLVYGLLGSLSLAVYSLLVRADLARLSLSGLQHGALVNVSGAALLALYLWVTGALRALRADASVEWAALAPALLLATAVGHLINFATVLQIQTTTPLTHNVSGTAKATVQSVLGRYAKAEAVSGQTWVGTFITVFGCAAYAYVRQSQPPSGPAAPRKAAGPVWLVPEAVSSPEWFVALARTARRFVAKPPAL